MPCGYDPRKITFQVTEARQRKGYGIAAPHRRFTYEDVCVASTLGNECRYNLPHILMAKPLPADHGVARRSFRQVGMPM